MDLKKARLVLEDGTVFEGATSSGDCLKVGEVVFNTSHTGYEEILTDPSYCGQIVLMTCAEIGNYGINFEDRESDNVQVSGFIVKNNSKTYSNHRAKTSLTEYLKDNNTPFLEQIDTREVVRHIREKGSMNGCITTGDVETALEAIHAWHGIVGVDLVKQVTCKAPYKWTEGVWSLNGKHISDNSKCKLVVMDYGVKRNILRSFADLDVDITVVPAETSFEEVDALKPDAVFLSNGPGDPAVITYGIEFAKKAIEKYPLFGICLGNQILSLACGSKTYKLKFGHHGGNQPVKNLITGKVEITAQNHCFAFDVDTITDDFIITHINLNDNTVEGVRHKEKIVYAVQYHPENAPGPHDASYLFEEFINEVVASKSK